MFYIMHWPSQQRTPLPAPDSGSGRGGASHYDPNQPRVPEGDPSHHGGRWTKAGNASMAAGLAAPAAETLPPLAALLRGLAGGVVAGIGSAVALAGGLIMLPLNRSHRDEGALPGDPEITYLYDQAFLTIWRDTPGGGREILFQGRPNDEGYYVTPDGAVIGRNLDHQVYLSAASIALEKRAASRPKAGARVRDDTVRYCPDPVPDRPNGASLEARLYQAQISGLPPGIAVELGGVMFDGCDETKKKMLEAKGNGFAWALRGSDWPWWYDGREKILDQLRRQSHAAADRIVEWHVAEKPVADVLRRLTAEFGFRNIQVIHTPPAYEITP